MGGPILSAWHFMGKIKVAENQCSWLLFPDCGCNVESNFTFLALSFPQDGRLYSQTLSQNKPSLRVFFKKKKRHFFFVTITKKLSNAEPFLQMSYLLIGYIVSVCEADGVILLISARNKSE